MTHRRTVALATLAVTLALAAPSESAEPDRAPKVVVSVLPVHSLVAGVMDGVGKPRLLIRGTASPHSYSLRPSDVRALRDAAAVFRVGPELEGFLDKPLAAHARGARVVDLTRVAGLEPYSDDGGPDPHIWLDPVNARRIADHAATVLGAIDPVRAGRYAANRDRLRARLNALDDDLRGSVEPVRGRPYVVFHDAYGYFERRYGLRAAAFLLRGPEHRPGARRLRGVRATIIEANVICVFSEPQFSPALLSALLRGTQAKAGVLDPLGAGIAPGPDAYFVLMRNLAASLRSCLSGR